MPDGLLQLLLEVAPSAEPILSRVLGSIKKESERDRIAQQLMLALMYEDAHMVRTSIEGLVKQNVAFADQLERAMTIATEGVKAAHSATKQVGLHNKDLKQVLEETREVHKVLAALEARLPPPPRKR